MVITSIMDDRNITKYRLAKNTGIPYTTISDICSGKAQLEKCSVETVYKIAKELGVSIETLIEPYMEERLDFELFKSNTCHRLKELGDIEFIIELLETNTIEKYHRKKWYPECLYLLAMLDYLSRENDVELCSGYDNLRSMKLKYTLYPSSVLVAAKVANNDEIKERAKAQAIAEFIRFNIVESEIRNVV